MICFICMVLKSIRSKCLTFRLNFAHFNFCSIRWFISIYYYCYGASDHTFATHRTFKWDFVTSFQQMALPQLLNWTNLFEHRFVSWLRASPLPFVWGNIFLWDFSPDFKQKKKCYFQRRSNLKDKNMFARNIETQSILIIIHTQFSSFFFRRRSPAHENTNHGSSVRLFVQKILSVSFCIISIIFSVKL